MIHTLLDYGVMWAASFALVFLLGLQSKNVQRSRYLAAIITSFGISVGNFTFIKYAAVGTLDAFWVCAVGGCMGIAFSIWFADNVLNRSNAKNCPVAPKGADRRAIQRTFGQKLDTLIEIERHLHRTGISMPGERNT